MLVDNLERRKIIVSEQKTRGDFIAVIGPMFSGKTGELIKRAQAVNGQVLVFKPSIDTRYGGGDAVHTHDGKSFEARLFDKNKPSEILSFIREFPGVLSHVFIDEIQFCANTIVSVVEEILSQGINVVVAGLDKDYKLDDFGSVPRLIEMAQEVVYLTAICDGCGGPATMSYARHPLDQIETVGADNIFGASCSVCYGDLRGDK